MLPMQIAHVLLQPVANPLTGVKTRVAIQSTEIQFREFPILEPIHSGALFAYVILDSHGQ